MDAPDAKAARFIDHIGIVVADADAAAALFAGRFGLEIGSDRNATATIQLVEPVGPGPVKQELDKRGEGMHHICLAVADLDATLAAQDGEDSPGVFTGGRGRRCSFLKENACGSLIELVEVAVVS
jgi:methylmalonyl-CoA/ethylmalonyl-CoA epimerase